MFKTHRPGLSVVTPSPAFKDSCQICAWQKNREMGHLGGVGSRVPTGLCQLTGKGFPAAALRQAGLRSLCLHAEGAAGQPPGPLIPP